MSDQEGHGAVGLLPALPDPTAVTYREMGELERRVAANVMEVDDVDVLEEWRAQAEAMGVYLRKRQMQGPMLGAQRRIEARLGQLLGDPQRGGDRRSEGFQPTHAYVERDGDRREFRLLARALGGDVNLNDEEWRSSRRALVKRIRASLPQEVEASAAANGHAAPGSRAVGQQRKLVDGMTKLARDLNSVSPHLDLAVAAHIPKTEETERWTQELREARTLITHLIGVLSSDV